MTRIIDRKNYVIIDTAKTLKAFGLVLYRRRESFKKKKDKSSWIKISSQRKATKKEVRKLNFWLRNHKKYVKRTLGEQV